MDSRVSFVKGRMNKSYDKRLLPEGEYIDAMNIRLGSTEDNSVGVIENTKGNILLAQLRYEGNLLSTNALCIGAYESGDRETIFWFVTDPGVVDMIVSYNTETSLLLYHVISTTVLNFNSDYLITGINLIDKYLFWTDNLNPPRKINIARTYYPPVSGVDIITVEDVNVIVAPPLEAPKVQMVSISGGENFIENVFISFAYRYKYKDNEYSALSQFTDVAFEPGQFKLNYSTYDNSGMENIFNAANVTFNTGDSNVIGIDLCFKFSDGNIVNIVEKYIKNEQGWGNNSTQSILFDNKKIYTTLPESELLRLYDNVPHIAKSQTTMGNRIMYGNYIDGYNIHDDNDKPIAIKYNLDLISENIDYKNLLTTSINAPYNISGSTINIDHTLYSIDFGSNPLLKQGSSLLINFNLQHVSFQGGGYEDASAPLNNFSYTLLFNLQQDYLNVADLASSDQFRKLITSNPPLGMSHCNDGFSVTDYFNCSMLAKSGWEKYSSGVNNLGEGFVIEPVTPGTNIIKIQIPAVVYRNISDPSLLAYEYLENVYTLASFNKAGNKRSLHSNRDYEVGIVYMDEYNRSTTALVCNTNTLFIPESKSITKNFLRASIPAGTHPPYWATRYKWVIKPSKTDYQTIYTNLYYPDPSNAAIWFYLEGDNRSKVKENDLIIVKTDSNGPLTSLVKAKVLGLKYKLYGDLGSGTSPEGSYMKIKPSSFYALYDQATFIQRIGDFLYTAPNNIFSQVPRVSICNLYTETSTVGVYKAIPIKAGSRVRIRLFCERAGSGHTGGGRIYLYDKTFVASNDYYNLHEYVIGDQIDLTSGIYDGTDDDAFHMHTIFNNPVDTYIPYINYTSALQLISIDKTNQIQFFHGDNGEFYIGLGSGTPAAGGHSSGSSITVEIQEPNNIIVFETEPNDADGEKFYEGSENFQIINGLHQGSSFPNTEGGINVPHNQTTTDPAVCNLGFFNCFTFGNGVESYKIDDSLTGAPMYLGSRVNAVSQQEYKQTLRYASITYSGVYNAESNINKLNEFNLGLANYKDLQKSFGPIQVLYARATDILTLQEDKISYVLQGKNLLSDAAAGGAITSIPEVLGTQIARIENFGISHNPESFATWGSEMVWTDAKRSSILKLTGSSYTNDQLDVLSDINMKVWFRDLFKNSFTTQKLMAYDPYMDEFVLSSNERPVIVTQTDQPCGLIFSQIDANDKVEFDVDLGNTIGNVVFDYDFSKGYAGLTVDYGSSRVIDTRINESGSVYFYKDNAFPSIAHVTITPVDATYSFTSNCPDNFEVTVTRIVINNHSYVNQTIHNSYNWTLNSFTSPTLTDNIVMESDGISLFTSQTGMSSNGAFPVDGSDLRMYSSKLSGDTYVFNDNKFRYLITDTLYTEAQINDIINSSTIVTPVLNPSTGMYNVDFTYSNPLGYPYVYLIWDYRNSSSISLCYSDVSATDVCCNC